MYNTKFSRSFERLKQRGAEALQKKRQKDLCQQQSKDLFTFRNSTKATLILPTTSADGKDYIEPGKTWKGDERFMDLVARHEATLVDAPVVNESVEVPQKSKKAKGEKKPMSEEKLILDQPEEVTVEGTVEHVKSGRGKKSKKNESTEGQNDVLLVEDPLQGVEILKD